MLGKLFAWQATNLRDITSPKFRIQTNPTEAVIFHLYGVVLANLYMPMRRMSTWRTRGWGGVVQITGGRLTLDRTSQGVELATPVFFLGSWNLEAFADTIQAHPCFPRRVDLWQFNGRIVSDRTPSLEKSFCPKPSLQTIFITPSV
jgi:hypothetical protein